MAGTYDGQVRIGTKIDDSDLAGDLEKLKSRLQNASANLRDVMQGPVQAVKDIGRAFQQIGQIINGVEADWASQEKAIAINKATLKATGAESWTTAEAQEALAAKLKKVTGYADEQVLSMQNVLLGFKNIKGDNFDIAATQILNMSKVMGMDLVSSAQAVGKALDDPIAGVDSLTRQGFRFSAAQKEVLKDLVNTGHMAEAQKIILDELATTYGGAAAAANETGSAIKEKLGLAVDELKERLGRFASDALAPSRKGLIELVNGLSDTFDVINRNSNAPEVLTKLATGLGAATAGVAAFVLVSQGHAIITALAGAIGAVNLAIAANPVALVAALAAAAIIGLVGLKTAEDQHTEALRKKIAASGDAATETNKLSTEYQTLHDKAKLSADEQGRMDEIARLLHEKFPDLTTDTINLAAANGTLAEKAEAAAKAQAKLNLSNYLATQNKAAGAAAETMQRTGEYRDRWNPGTAAYNLADKAYQDAKADWQKIQDGIESSLNLYNKTWGTGSSMKPSLETPSAGGQGASTAIPQGSRLKALDDEYKASIALAEELGQNTALIEEEWYDKRLKLLGDFVVEDAKKNISVADSLRSDLLGTYGLIGDEIDATLKKQAALATQYGSLPEDPAQQAVSVEEWTSDYLGAKAFESLQKAATEGLQAADVEEWAADFLGKKVFDAMSNSATEGLQASDVEEWVTDHLGAKAFEALQAAATDGLQSSAVEEWCDEYLGKNAFQALQDAADEGLQASDVEDWATNYLGEKAFQALTDAATLGLQEADVTDWANDYLGKNVFEAIQANAEKGLQESEVEQWVQDWLNAKLLANSLDAADQKIQAAAVAAWIADYKKNHGTVAAGGDGWIAYDNYLEEMRKKTDLAPWQSAGIVGTEEVGKNGMKTGEISGGTEVGNIFGDLITLGKAFADSLGGILGAVGALSSVQQILNPLTTIISSMMEVLGPVINDVLGPVVGMLKLLGEALGQILAPAIQLLTPIIKFISELFVFLYNEVIVPIGNVIIKAFNWIYNGIVSVLNWMIEAINWALGWLGVNIATIAKKSADEGTLTTITTQDVADAGSTDADTLKEQNEALKANKELWTLASKAADAYAAVLTKVKSAAASFYDSLKSVGTEITSALIDNLVNGFSEDDFLYAIEEYITKSVIQAAVFTESFMASVASIGADIAAGIANGFSVDELSALRGRLATLYQNAAAEAGAVLVAIEGGFASSYDVGSLSVKGDQYAKIHDGETILTPGLSEEARRAGIYIGPVGNLDSIGSAGLAATAKISLTLNLDGSITADGREIGRLAYQHFDEFAGSAYGNS